MRGHDEVQGGGLRNLPEIPGLCEMGFSFLVLGSCLCSGIWKVVVRSQQASLEPSRLDWSRCQVLAA